MMDDLYMQNGGAAGRALRVQLPICDRTLTSEVSCDVSLPDYQPEIKRLLRVSASVQPPSHYVGGGAVEFSGAVDLCIYYTGNDGRMYCYPTSGDYTARTPLEVGTDFDLNDAPVCDVHTEVESVTNRVSGPRRMSVKCRLRSHVCVYASCVVEQKRSGEGATGEERLLCDMTVARWCVASGVPFGVSETVALEREGEGEYRIISGDARVLMSEASYTSGGIRCRGEVVLKLLVEKESEGALPEAYLRRIPFEHDVAMEGAGPDGEASACGYCTELKLSMEDGGVACEVELVIKARQQRKETLSYVCDAYAVKAASTANYRTLKVPQGVRCPLGSFTQNEVFSLAEQGVTPQSVDVIGECLIESVGIENGRVIVSGKSRYTVVMNGEGELVAKDYDAPWRYVVEGVRLPEDSTMRWQGSAELLGARARGDVGRLSVDGEIGLWLCLQSEQEVSTVSTMSVGERIERPHGELLLCYPDRDDTLWSVGKRYAVAQEELLRANRIENGKRADAEGSLGAAHVLLIP